MLKQKVETLVLQTVKLSKSCLEMAKFNGTGIVYTVNFISTSYNYRPTQHMKC